MWAHVNFFHIYIVVVVEITSALQKTLMNECSHHQALKFNSFLRALFEKMCHCNDKNEESELVQKNKMTNSSMHRIDYAI